MFNIILPKILFNIERWKWNSEYRIYVSNTGKFKDQYKNNIPIKLSNKGYVQVITPYGFKLAHRLVMLTWNPIPNAEDLTVDHLNHNKRDNSLKNLEWVSKNENEVRARRDELTLKDYENIPIYCNEQVFNSLDEATDYVYKLIGATPNEFKDRVKKRIIKAIETQKPYCNQIWRN